MNRKKTEADRKLLKLLESDGDEAVLGDEFKSELVKQIMIKSVESDEYCASGRALCTQCKTLLSATDGGHVFRHLDRCTGKRAASEPIPETSDESLRSVEPLAKQRKLADFSKRQFTKEQTSKITRALAKHALRTGNSFNYMGGDCMRDLVIDVANATGSGISGKEAKAQIPHRQTIQTHTLRFSDELIKRAFGELKPYVGKQRVNLIVDHGKIVSNYLSMFASYIDDTFKLRLLPIGFIPSTDSKTGADTADAIIDRLQSVGWSEEEARACSITADGALANLGTHFSSYIRCVSHSIHLLGEKVVDPLEKHAKMLDPEIMKLLPIARECLDNAQNVSSAIRNNFQACSEMSRLPTLPNDTRWLNGLKCLVDVTELNKEILDLVSKLSLKGRTSMYWLNDHPEYVNAVLHILKPLLTYSIDFQRQDEVTIHRVLPAYKVILNKWSAYKDRDFTKIMDKDIVDLDLIEAMATSGLKPLQHYYSQFGTHHYGATLLSPRTKHMKNFTKEERKRAVSYISEMLPKDLIDLNVDTTEVPEYILEMSDNTEKAPTHSELKRYLDESFNVKSSEKIEEYWSRKRLDYPALYTVATKVLSIVPSESVCETTFSTAAFLLDKRRTRLRTETVEKIVVGSQIASKNPDWVDDLKTN
ncbi:hypothetical protein L5515_003418 [Caenorhabditis briggsae]|uniref:HAT C-terminal dimerisation domain-containing protein n=1 Tax=Caenorhabditis briggsae TaxID=6238 RepID=A0AAE9EJ67_CAEBR|nr:hypothetical protein L5515_003418 [Caenorhabditis briggsae]